MVIKFKLFLLFNLITAIGHSQESSKIHLKELESFMNKHIPDGHLSVRGYKITLRNGVLDKYTLVDGGESHHMTYVLKNATFQLDHNKLEGEEAEIYGFTDYWDVEIDGR